MAQQDVPEKETLLVRTAPDGRAPLPVVSLKKQAVAELEPVQREKEGRERAYTADSEYLLRGLGLGIGQETDAGQDPESVPTTLARWEQVRKELKKRYPLVFSETSRGFGGIQIRCVDCPRAPNNT